MVRVFTPKDNSSCASKRAPVFATQNLSVGYGKHILVKNLNLTVEAGDFIAIVGSNGSGKSTLVKTILGLIPKLSGKIEFFDEIKHPHGTKTSHQLPKIGYLPQETHVDSNFPATVREIVLSGTLSSLGFKPFYSQPVKTLVKDVTKLLKIDHLINKSFSELSGGQRQKVLLARALVATDFLLILDEPSNNLDHNSRKDFYATLKKLNAEHNLTILMITHDLDADDLIGNKVLSLKDGTATLYHTTDYLQYYHPTHEILDKTFHEPSKEGAK